MNTNNIYIRKMTDNDYGLMTKWLSTKEVLEFYGDINSPFTLEQVKEKYEPRVRGESRVTPFIVELDSLPIGFMQHYKLQAKVQKKYGYLEHQIIYGIDQFIGVPKLFNKGYGTIMVSKFIDLISKTTDAEIIILDPEISNERAIRCYEKCGFSQVKKINNDSALLMEFKNTQF
ncbi:GNAT family N-acetyltransferase [Lysinibacillus sp. 2017]|uniref:GNAT family N-acetyltransferase n=1 Tax=unclassified Lysinibacillus TaxID=2636778 RepID=UPI000D525CFC|nr:MULTISPECIES: GNAT family N-acetyltransferase [unclassified Lysinibacillus]AWE07670.1 GNAT family N-acetyltransferase [Lysinibacillus sp. 2017]TGN36833.1 GNAT family N-acetyltransferase [Lysinibacillus sp. S2017]